MNVFVDFHHAGLLNSLIMLFEKRLGGMVYRPIGTEWHKQGYWKVYDHPATVQQYLGIGGSTPDGTQPLNEVVDSGHPYVYQCKDIDSGEVNRGVTFEGFLNMDFDIVIATMPQHIQPFKKLIRRHKPNAKMIFQIGNAWTVGAGLAPNIMASAVIRDVPKGINLVTYHQEFDDKNIFHLHDTVETKTITSFINAYNTEVHFKRDWELFQKIEGMMPEWDFKSYGGQCRDGAAHGAKEVAAKMAQTRFIWHVKDGGDGYGHILHNAFAMGIPVIIREHDYIDKLGHMLLEDGKTALFIDGLTPHQIKEKIAWANEPARYDYMRGLVYNKYKSVVDFDAEEAKLRQFIADLK